MHKIWIALIPATLLAFGAFAQDEDAPDATAAEESEVEEEEEEEVEDADLDESTYEEDEDDFIPTEEIPADEPIPFPTNI